MTSHRRAVAAVMFAAGFSMVASAAPAYAETTDERFTEAVTKMGIEVAPDTDLPEAGRQVCDMLTAGVVGNVNPVPAIRGVVTTLTNSGLSREQAVGMMRVSVAAYCPHYARYVSR
ncbi:MAG: DUF732 domain-containing protein [Actinomycetia bacterium]|nr:DUF732 domain-containing protein [Actinomycetes bacterium]